MEGTHALASPGAENAHLDEGRCSWLSGTAAHLTILVLLAAGVRFWLLGHSEVAARDSIGYIRYAHEFEIKPWSTVVRASEQHPGYPMALLAVSWPVRYFMGATTPAKLAPAMQISAQLTTILAGILLVFPLYFLGWEFYDRRIAFWATALFQCLPATARVTADGLSEGVFFLAVVSALWLLARALRSWSLLQFGIAGIVGGLAYMTRPEGALVVVAAALCLVLFQAAPHMRRPWRRVLASEACLLACALLTASPYYLTTGHFTNKPTPRVMMGEKGLLPQAPDPISKLPAVGPGVPLAMWAPPNLSNRTLWGLKAVVSETVHALSYVLIIPLIAGLWIYRQHLARCHAAWLLSVLCLLQLCVLWRLATVLGYVSERHVLLLVLCGLYSVAAALDALGSWLVRSRLNLLHVQWLGAVPLVLLTFCWLPSTLKPLHANREGHRQAGKWLAQHSHPWDKLEDPCCWAHYYSGRVFTESATTPTPADQSTLQFTVLDRQDHIRLPKVKARGDIVYTWPENKPPSQAKVLVYSCPETK